MLAGCKSVMNLVLKAHVVNYSWSNELNLCNYSSLIFIELLLYDLNQLFYLTTLLSILMLDP